MRFSVSAACLAAAGLLVLPGSTALAQHLDDFELEGDATDVLSLTGDDWDVVHAGGGSALVKTYVHDEEPDTSIFFTGDSKDEHDVADWLWTAGSVPDKDDITNAYAAAYAGDVLYFGADRFATNGSSEIGFWFFKDDVALLGDGTFFGHHMTGDILILSNFTVGGKISEIHIYEWLETGTGSDGFLDLLVVGEDCSMATPSTLMCAIVNASAETAPWAYTNKSGSTGTFEPGAFFEGGIDLAALQGSSGCFNTFMAETRSSHSLDAQLKDFVIGAFETCELDVIKTGTELSKQGDLATYTFQIINKGIKPLYLDAVVDSELGDLTAAALAAGCGSLASANGPSAQCTFTVERAVPTDAPDPYVNLVTAQYNSAADLTGDSVTAHADHTMELFQPGVSVVKTGPPLAEPGFDAAYDITITNTSSADSPDLVLSTVTDSLLGDVTAAAAAAGCSTLAYGASCTFTLHRTVLESDPDPLVNTVSVLLHPEGFPNPITAQASHSTNLFQAAVSLVKTGTALSKIGDPVSHVFTVTNISSGDSPALTLTSFTDTVLGDLTSAALAAGCDGLSPGQTCSFTTTTTVPGDAPDPLENVATVTYAPMGFGSAPSASDSHAVNLFQPAVSLTKTGDDLGLAGEPVSYTFTIENVGSTDSPPLVIDSMDDTLLGDLTNTAKAHACTWLAPGATCQFSISRTVLPTDPDPTPNVATVHFHPDGFGNDITASDDHAVDLFYPSVQVVADGTPLSKVGDTVSYDFTITNTSSADTPDMALNSVIDTLLGDITADALAAGCGTLASGASCTFTLLRTVMPGDPDPLGHTVTISYTPTGFATAFGDNDSHETELFQPQVDVVKSGPALAEVGAEVVYTFTIANPGSPDSPPIILDSVSDDVLGPLETAAVGAGCGSLESGESCTFTVSRVVAPGDPDPLHNVVTVHYHPDGFPNDLVGQDDHVTNLFQASVELDKTGTALSKIGDPVSHTFTVTNTSSADSPALALDSFTDTVLGDLMVPAVGAGCDALAPGATCAFTVTSTVPEDAPDPLVNEATVGYHPAGFASVLVAGDDHSVNLFQPSVDVTKAGDVLAVVGTEVEYVFTIENTGSDDSPDLMLDSVTDTLLGDLTTAAAGAGCDQLAPGATCTFTATRVVVETDPDPLDNTVTVHYHPDGFPNDITASDDHTVNLAQPGVVVSVVADELSKVGDPVTYTITIACAGSPDSPSMTLVSVVDTVLGDLMPAAVAAGCDGLAPGGSCTFQVVRAPQAADPDPLAGTTTVVAHAAGYPEQTCSHSCGTVVELFQPGLAFTMDSQHLAEVGTLVAYEFGVANTSSEDGPPIVLDSLTDTLLGDLKPTAIAAGCGVLASGAYCEFTVLREVQPTDPDPLLNTATVHYHPDGFPNDLMAVVGNQVELFQKALAVTKSGDTLGKVGDPATYHFTIENPSTPDTPDLHAVSITDTVLGDLTGIAATFGCGVLASGASCSFDVTRVVQPTDPDPLHNVVTAVYSPEGFDTEVSATDEHTVELFQPAVDIAVTGPTYSKHGDTATFTVVATNLSSTDSPPLTCSVVIDALGFASGSFAMGPGDTWTTTIDHVVSEPPDLDPLVALAALYCTVDGFGNVLEDEDSHPVDLVHPDLSVSKSCLTDPVAPGASANFRIAVENLGDVPLEVHIVDVVLGIDETLTLPVMGASCVPDAYPDDGCYAIEAGIIASGDQVANSVTVTATLPAEYGLDNVLTRTDDAVCDVQIVGATRTPGFWKTHDAFTCHVFEEHLSSFIDLGWTTLESCADVFGMFWSANARDSQGKKRPQICHAQVHGSYHLLAATLNDALDNGAPMPIDVVTGDDLLTAMKAAMAAGDFHEIKRLGELLANYNESSDDVALVDGCGAMVGHADPKAAKAVADYTAGDCQ